MSVKKVLLSTVFAFTLLPAVGLARDTVLHLNFNSAVERATRDGVLDGSVRFRLATSAASNHSGRQVIVNKKTNAFGKSDEDACDHVLRSALITLQNSAKRAGANAVVDIVSFYKRNEYRSAQNYECHAGAVVAGVALKGRLSGGR